MSDPSPPATAEEPFDHGLPVPPPKGRLSIQRPAVNHGEPNVPTFTDDMKMRWIMVARVDADLQIPDSTGQLARSVRLSISVDPQPIREHSGEQRLHG
ncbi:MAG: hypothetical protein ACK52I_04340 [Pseudomonadota bacterium]